MSKKVLYCTRCLNTRVLILYERPFLKLHALNSRKIQISCGFLADWFCSVARKFVTPLCLQLAARSDSHTTCDVNMAKRSLSWCLPNNLQTMYICMYIKRYYYMKTKKFLKNPKLVTLLLNVCFDVWCHASKLDWSTVSLLSNVKKSTYR